MMTSLLPAQEADKDLADLSIEELLNESVTSVSKKTIRLAESPAAITSLSRDEIHRQGITLLPDALRMVPGLDVARANGPNWGISSRGFNTQHANKLLVLIDGRSVYTPMFGGVYWDVQDVMMEDLDRIEVIRGPGATLWGANAVNGVINVTSRDARETQGTLVSTAFGTEERPSVSLRHGGTAGTGLHYRVYAKYADRAGLVDSTGADTHDGTRSWQTGFRADWERSGSGHLTLQGDYYEMRPAELVAIPNLTPPFGRTQLETNRQRGGNLLGRWVRTDSDTSHLLVQAYYDHFRHRGGMTLETRDTFDLQIERRMAVGERHDVVAGFGYRVSQDEVNDTPVAVWEHNRARLHLVSAFFQDEITLQPERLALTVGSKIEHNDFTGVEVQPSVRLLWTPTERQTLWAAISRAVSTPSRVFRDARFNQVPFQPDPAGPVIQPALLADPNFESEKVTAYELGYRTEPVATLSFDLALFYNEYRNMTAIEAGTPTLELDPAPPHLLLPLHFTNSGHGPTYGGELSAQWKPTRDWRLIAAYTYLRMKLQPGSGSVRTAPRHQASLRSYLSLPRNWELSGAVYFVDRYESPSITSTIPIPAYTRLDLGVVWRPTTAIELGLWGKNLLDPQHPEITATYTEVRSEVPRSFLAQLVWRF
jgi:iron complex outermembrane receptor protein